MKKTAFLFSACEYNDSFFFKKTDLDLPSVKNDIISIEKRLTQIGFNIIKKENAYKKEYFEVLASAEIFAADSINIVYFSGHGGHFNGENYICPSDFGSIYDVTHDITSSCINIKDIISFFKDKGKLIIILDACRSTLNEIKEYYSEITSGKNVYIAYGTMFQKEAFCGSEKEISWFTEAICDEILTPNIDVDTLFMHVRRNVYNKHQIQIPMSVNTLLEPVVLNPTVEYGFTEQSIYDFIEKYGDEYNEIHGYFSGEYLVFIDAAQFFNIGLLDTYWYYTKVQNKIASEKGINMPRLTEAEQKLVTFLGFVRGKKYFYHDMSFSWYFNGRPIRMGEIPQLPQSMLPELPEEGKEVSVFFNVKRIDKRIEIATNLPNDSIVSIKYNDTTYRKEYTVKKAKISINDATLITKILIDGPVRSDNPETQKILGKKCRNLVGPLVNYNPIFGNQVYFYTAECSF